MCQPAQLRYVAPLCCSTGDFSEPVSEIDVADRIEVDLERDLAAANLAGVHERWNQRCFTQGNGFTQLGMGLRPTYKVKGVFHKSITYGADSQSQYVFARSSNGAI